MPTSKLMTYLDIAKSLTESGPQTFDQLTSLLKIDKPALLKQRLIFFIAQEIIREKDTYPNVTYMITERGLAVLKFFRILPSRVTIEPNSTSV